MTETIVGAIVVVLALSALVGLIVWSRRIVERIHRRDLKTLRQIRKGLGRGE